VPKGEEGSGWTGDYFSQLRKLVYPGCVVVVECGGEPHAGKFGEMTSWALQQGGARGIVLDSYIRDLMGLELIPNFTPCARGTSPIESSQRWQITAVNVTIGMPGTLTSRVRVNPGDWIVAEADGVIVVPQAIAMEALVKAEAVEAKEQGMRQDFAAGMSFDDAYNKWGRA
jgi:regulator of RNase E activity RraA